MKKINKAIIIITLILWCSIGYGALRTVSIHPSGSTAPGEAADYTSMQGMETGENGDLVTATTPIQCNIQISDGNWNTADTTVVWTGWTTDLTNDLTITVLDDGSRNLYTDGLYSTTSYRMETATIQNIMFFSNAAQFDATFQHVQLKNTKNDGRIFAEAAHVNGTANFEQCYIENTTWGILWSAGEGNLNLVNCIIVGGTSGHVLTGSGATATIYNCTFDGIGTTNDSIESNGITFTVKNVATFNNTDDFQDLFTAIDFTAHDDGAETNETNHVDISPGATEADDWNDAFSNYASKDYRVKDASSVLHESGLDPDSDALIPSLDIAGNSRPTGANGVSIGAFELVAPAEIVIFRRRIQEG